MGEPDSGVWPEEKLTWAVRQAAAGPGRWMVTASEGWGGGPASTRAGLIMSSRHARICSRTLPLICPGRASSQGLSAAAYKEHLP